MSLRWLHSAKTVGSSLSRHQPAAAQEMFPEAVAAGNGFMAGWDACDRERNSAREEVERLKKLLAEANAELEKYKNSRFELEQRAMGLSDSAC
jgi:hypothetical protein